MDDDTSLFSIPLMDTGVWPNKNNRAYTSKTLEDTVAQVSELMRKEQEKKAGEAFDAALDPEALNKLKETMDKFGPLGGSPVKASNVDPSFTVSYDSDPWVKMLQIKAEAGQELTLMDAMTLIATITGVAKVTIVYNNLPEEAAIIVEMSSDMRLRNKAPGGMTKGQIVDSIDRTLSRLVVTDCKKLEWTTRSQGEINYANKKLSATLRSNEDGVSRPDRPEDFDANKFRVTERYGYGVIHPGAIARAGAISTD